MRCIKCHRKLTREPIQGMGPTCAKNTLGAKPKREKREPVKRDERTMEMFA